MAVSPYISTCNVQVFLCFWQIRVNAFLCLGDMVSRLDKHAVLDILQTIQRCTAVDRSPPTLMCTLGVANSIFKKVIFALRGLIYELHLF